MKDPKNEIFPIIKWVGEKNRIFNVHLRNIKGGFNNFQKMYPDNGEMNFLHVARALRDVGCAGMVMPNMYRTTTVRRRIFKLFHFVLGISKS